LKSLSRHIFILFIAMGACCVVGRTQMITGTWHGKINKQRVEVKIIQNGDSLTGTSYYYDSPTRYRRYSIKGYFDAANNDAVWWDDQLIEVKPASQGRGKVPLLARADFNCPGDGRMMLNGKAGEKTDPDPDGDVQLDKIGAPSFPDEWDYVLDNFTQGANDPDIIDSISLIATNGLPVPVQPEKEIIVSSGPVKRPVISAPPATTNITPAPVTIVPPATIEEKFITRKKVLVTEIPVSGDSIELRFYDNAEIDGDSISLFLNNKLLFQHIRLLGSAYTIKLAVSDLGSSNELIMVAENLGSIPPNTSFMVAEVGGKRYEARLESTEGSSAMIRFVKQ
jgi:hypothetical protein